MNEILSYEFLGNSIQTYAVGLGIIILSFLVTPIIKAVIKKFAQDREVLQEWTNKFISPLVYLITLYVVLNTFEMSDDVYRVINVMYIVLTTWYITRIVVFVFSAIIRKYLEKTRTEEDRNRIKPLFSFLNLLIWLLGFLFMLNYLGFEVTTALAGLGIGGIAVALAAQALLGDLFSYFVIYFDKPFEIGDFLVFDDKKGVVEKIGIKSTKIRALSGEILVVSNSNLTNSRLHNYKKMERRRVAFIFGVTYQTNSGQLKVIPAVVKEIIESIELTTFDRTHFKGFGNFSLDFECVYFVKSNDYNVYMDIQEKINLRIYEEFEKRGIEFAYPTQTLYINKEN
ncbi:MAG: mechanosensitive ion channel family protein [Melioribacteraceae bacterium]|nr:mechanosensitive ion channel family protein [Melioribacteraceae bacterium]